MAGKMVISVVHPEDAAELIRILNNEGFRVTRMATSGGFLRQGKSTLMIGVPEEQVDLVVEIIRANTHARSRRGWWRRPGKHQEGAAIVFVMNMEQAQWAALEA